MQENDEVSYIWRIAAPSDAFAAYLRENGETSDFEKRLRRYGGPALEGVWRIVVAPSLDVVPDWRKTIIEDYMQNGSRNVNEADAETHTIILRLPPSPNP